MHFLVGRRCRGRRQTRLAHSVNAPRWRRTGPRVQQCTAPRAPFVKGFAVVYTAVGHALCSGYMHKHRWSPSPPCVHFLVGRRCRGRTRAQRQCAALAADGTPSAAVYCALCVLCRGCPSGICRSGACFAQWAHAQILVKPVPPCVPFIVEVRLPDCAPQRTLHRLPPAIQTKRFETLAARVVPLRCRPPQVPCTVVFAQCSPPQA